MGCMERSREWSLKPYAGKGVIIEEGKIENLGDSLLICLILSKISPIDLARLACVNKRFYNLASHDSIWRPLCYQQLYLSSCVDPFANPLPSYKVAYKVWREAFNGYPFILVQRVKRCCDRLKSWFGSNFPEVGSTLRGGVSEDEINEIERRLKVKLPLSTRLIIVFAMIKSFILINYLVVLVGAIMHLITL